LRENEALKEAIAAAADTPVYAVDLRGIGDSRPDTTNENSYLSPYGSDYFYAIHGLMLDDPYPLQRTRDLLTVLNWLKSIGHPRVHLWANGWGSIAGTLASVYHPVVTQVTLQHSLTSFDELARAEEYDWPLSSMIPDV